MASDACLPQSVFRDGAVAQLGERLNGIQEVGGSIPLGSTSLRLDGATFGSAMWITIDLGRSSVRHNGSEA